MKMTTEEAFVKTLQRHGIEHAFGIIGSAFMPISDLFPKAGITFWDCAHSATRSCISKTPVNASMTPNSMQSIWIRHMELNIFKKL